MKGKNDNTKYHLVYVGPLYWEILSRRGGNFPDSSDEEVERSFACWHAAKCAHIAFDQIPSQVTLEGDTDITINLRNTVGGAIRAYGLDPDDNDVMTAIMNLMPLARQRAFMIGATWSSRFQAWLDSGGKSYSEVTREPDAI